MFPLCFSYAGILIFTPFRDIPLIGALYARYIVDSLRLPTYECSEYSTRVAIRSPTPCTHDMPLTHSNWLSLPLQPFQCQTTLLKIPAGLAPDILMISIQPMNFLSCQSLHINQFPTIRNHGNMLKSQIWLVSKLVLRFNFLDKNHVFNSDTEFPIFVISWFVGEDIAWCKRNFGELDACTDADWAFVDIEIRTNAMTRAVTIIKAFFLRDPLV